MRSALPSYVVINDDEQSAAKRQVLRNPAEIISFPLSKEDSEVMKILEAKFDTEENCAGLAAPQIGFNKRIIVFSVPDDENLKKWRTDLVETMPKTIWINPIYEGIGNDKTSYYEGCFSVRNLAGEVARFKSIKYEAYLPTGQKITGIANGFLARVIQHEVDHVNGTLFMDYVQSDKLLDIEEYRKKRAATMNSLQE